MRSHFSIAELTASQTAIRKGIDNTPPPEVLANLSRTIELLEQVRLLANGPIIVSSGYRCPNLNRVIGGSSTSAHVRGMAADITAIGITPKRLAQLIQASTLIFDQLIYEGNWVHIGLSTGSQRRQILTAHFAAGRATYTGGIA